ncbi:WhiB family transcriptional regulator [Pseudonocardia kujensis]|uniref:WhiB family transcriptional regulator n=1 Tax=Pseudonocardia kujensis TaxID=1128675 RepID=UPI0022B7E30B|nr:WhiB family transcriptional regulator [Pseudonocardia kujensis]
MVDAAASRWNWRIAARCRTADAEELFVRGAEQRRARQFCAACPVRTECLAHALDERVEFGVWGGTTERERRALLRSRPGVRSWAELLRAARAEHYAAGTPAESAESAEEESAAEESAAAMAELLPSPDQRAAC